MTRCYTLFVLFILLLICSVTNLKSQIPQSTPFAIIELYTSQGCSNCFIADQLIDELYRDTSFLESNFILLSFHVDYWNERGWVDPLSKAKYTERQNHYVQLNKSKDLYTPELFINGESGFPGTNGARLKRELLASSKGKFNEEIALSAIRIKENRVLFHFERSDSLLQILNAALVSDRDTSTIQSGENAGKLMISRNTVRSYMSMSTDKRSGNVYLNLPIELSTKKLKLILWLQDSNTGKVLGASSSEISQTN